ncbi:hypothetical protein [Winogradskyella sp.]|uniref:hypothetical protein n=1 Tax=Winogradskyella sp. TaxID=1883156 RepID=UPI002602FD39|nr:hypothetical protein [Winogradskyella sp.]
MIQIHRPSRPKISIYSTKNTKLDRNLDKANMLRNTLKNLIDKNDPNYASILERLDSGAKFTRAEVETLKAIAFFADLNNFNNNKKITDKSNIKFTVYKNDKLKEHLKEIFNDKCAYCESKFTHVTPPDIEHFRPKAAINPFTNQVDEDLIYPGYYWLGADWDNLLWSCPLCNRKTKQMIPDEVEPTAVGKKNRFPVITNRIRNHHELVSAEEADRLLIDPCRENPADHLEFLLDGRVVAKLNDQNEPSLKGEASIPAYALNREQLRIWRRQEGTTLKGLLVGIKNTIINLINEDDPDEKQSIKDDFLELKDIIKQMFLPGAQYLAQKDVVINDFFKKEGLEAIGLTKEGLLN